MTEQYFRDIELGPRQLLLFDAENEAAEDQHRMLAFVTAHIEAHGHALLDDFVPMAAGTLAWSPFKVLQHIFWLSHDLKLHFRIDGERITPGEARKVLIASRPSVLQVVLNKPVDQAVLSAVKILFKRMTGDPACDAGQDQTAFARRLVRQIRDWKNTLASCRFSACQPGFPGKSAIDASLAVIDAIAVKLDPFSLIHAFYDHAATIEELDATIQTLADFYARQSDKWQMMLRFADESRATMAGHIENPSVAAAYDRFRHILSSPQPYGRVEEAWQSMQTAKPWHDRIMAQQVQQCRQAALAEVASLVEKMKQHLNAHAGSADLRNQSLLDLRTRANCIEAARTTAMIERRRQEAEEAFELAWEAVLDGS